MELNLGILKYSLQPDDKGREEMVASKSYRVVASGSHQSVASGSHQSVASGSLKINRSNKEQEESGSPPTDGLKNRHDRMYRRISNRLQDAQRDVSWGSC